MFIFKKAWLETGVQSHLLTGRHMVFGPFNAFPEWGTLFPGQALQHLLLHMVQMLHHLPDETFFRPNQHLDHLMSGRE